MELSPTTLEILKNFSSINQSIYIRQKGQDGQRLETLSISNRILGRAKIEEEFPDDIPIYNLPEFLNLLSLYTKPVLEFHPEEKAIGLRDEAEDRQEMSSKYMYSDLASIHYPSKMLPVPKNGIAFHLSREHLEMLIKATNVLKTENVLIKPHSENQVLVMVVNMDNKEGTNFTLKLPAEMNGHEKFELVFNVTNLKVVPRNYNIAVSEKLYTHWVSEDVEYFIALEKASSID